MPIEMANEPGVAFEPRSAGVTTGSPGSPQVEFTLKPAEVEVPDAVLALLALKFETVGYVGEAESEELLESWISPQH
ncbi:MAG: hypothetical protein IH851_09730 [Armatimonadetes bacterium]|nr:hypothetical protein [Armatimonadota bacterium]